MAEGGIPLEDLGLEDRDTTKPYDDYNRIDELRDLLKVSQLETAEIRDDSTLEGTKLKMLNENLSTFNSLIAKEYPNVDENLFKL